VNNKIIKIYQFIDYYISLLPSLVMSLFSYFFAVGSYYVLKFLFPDVPVVFRVFLIIFLLMLCLTFAGLILSLIGVKSNKKLKP
jgi:hypothetical protein